MQIYSTLAQVFNYEVWKGQRLETLLDYYTIALNKLYKIDFDQKSQFGNPIDAETGEEIKFEEPFYNCNINSHYAQK